MDALTHSALPFYLRGSPLSQSSLSMLAGAMRVTGPFAQKTNYLGSVHDQ